MITDKIDEYLNRKKKPNLIKEDIDSVDVTDDIIRLIESLDDTVLDDEQIELKDKILSLLDKVIEDNTSPDAHLGEQPVDPDEVLDNGYSDDPETDNPFEMSADKYYEDQTQWVKGLSEGKKKVAGKKKNSVKKPEKVINKNKKKN